MKRPVCVVAAGMDAATLRLQPWRALLGAAEGLAREGHRVVVISDGPRNPWPGGIPVVRVPSVRVFPFRPNRTLRAAIACSGAEAVIWHLGLTSTLHQRWPRALAPAGRPVVGFWTAPLYSHAELAGLVPRALLRGPRASLIHILGALLPRWAVRAGLRATGVDVLVTQTATTAGRLREMGLWHGPLATIPPGCPDVGHAGPAAPERGTSEGAKMVVYFGPPAPLRGLDTLVEAVALARRRLPALRLLVLSRRRGDEYAGEMQHVRRLLGRRGLDGAVRIVDGWLTADELARHLSAADIVALPFQLISSDAPLSVVEARALGKPVVTTRVGCLPELAGGENDLLAWPWDPHSLCDALLAAAGREEVGRPAVSRSWVDVGVEWSALVEGL